MKPVIVIVGPTGVGKTKLSIELAKRMDAEIINGDSVAIYKKLNIGSAKPTLEEQKEAVHHLIDIREPAEEYSVYDYQKDARDAIFDIDSRGRRVIVVGGTGLYIKAALYNYIFTKESDKKTYDDMTNEEILEKLMSYDSQISIHPNNRKRLVRALNKFENGDSATHGKDECLYPIYVVGLTSLRSTVYDRINQRVESMMENGLLEEVLSLKEDYKHSRVLTTAIGYKEFIPYFSGQENLDEVIQKIQLHSRRYAKRQYTFFNHQFDTHWYDVNFDDFNQTIEEVYQDIKKQEAD